MKTRILLACMAVATCHLRAAAAEQNTRGILERSLQAQQSFRSLEGEHRSRHTNFAPDDNTLASDHAGRFVIARSTATGAVDRLFSRDFDQLKGVPGDSSSQYINGVANIRIEPDGTGETDELSYITSTYIVSDLNYMERKMRLMIDSVETVEQSDTVIDGRACYLLALHTRFSDGDGWCKLAIDKQNMLPLWCTRRDRATGNFKMDQSSWIELRGLKVNMPVDSSVFDAAEFKMAPQAVLGSCQVGETAPKWKDVPDAVTGRLYSLDSLLEAGNVVVMDWSTSTCGACIMAMPTIDSLYRHYRKEGAKVAFVMMNPGDSRKQALSLIERKGIEYPVLLCRASVAEAYGLQAYPVFLVVGRDGQIVFNQGGFGTGSPLYQRLKEAVDKALVMESQ